MSLFEYCELCRQRTSVSIKTTGSLLTINQYCSSCIHCRKWTSQHITNKIPVGNLLISAAILSSGLLPQKVLRFFEYLNCPVVSKSRFFVHQKQFLYPAINDIWKTQQSDMLALLEAYGKPLSLGGDARCDSPGFSAKYGSYTVMDLEHKVVIDIQLVQVRKNDANINITNTIPFHNTRVMRLKGVLTWKKRD